MSIFLKIIVFFFFTIILYSFNLFSIDTVFSADTSIDTIVPAETIEGGDVAPIPPQPKKGVSAGFGVGTGLKLCSNNTEIDTAIGCVPTDPVGFIKAVSRLATGAGGGVALLLMIAGVFRMMTSAGNPDGVKAGSEQFTSALIGLLFIIFAVLLLKVIGVDILNIPGFGPI